MRDFLKSQFNTDKIQNVDLADLKKRIEGDHMIERTQHRKAFANMLAGKKKVLSKGEVFRSENLLASKLDSALKNEFFGFQCLHYSVSEASGFLRIKIHNKKKKASKVGVRTVDGDAKEKVDYDAIDEIIEFKTNEWHEIEIKVHDDDDWEPDVDFYVELYEPETGEKLVDKDCRTTVTIIDDDKPGILGFEKKNFPSLKHIATEPECIVKVIR